MNKDEIEVGRIYTNGKGGKRELIRVCRHLFHEDEALKAVIEAATNFCESIAVLHQQQQLEMVPMPIWVTIHKLKGTLATLKEPPDAS